MRLLIPIIDCLKYVIYQRRICIKI